MKLLSLILSMFLTFSAHAKDGVVIQFSIDEFDSTLKEKRTYTNSVLTDFNETSSIDFENQYTVKISSRSNDSKSTNLIISLKDLSSGKPYYIGAKSLDVVVGDSSSYEIKRNDILYVVNIDTSYGKLP